MAEQIFTKDYSIYIGRDALSELQAFLNINTFSSHFILVDSNTNQYCLKTLLEEVPFLKGKTVIEIPAGEENKHLESCQKVWQALTNEAADRNALLVNLGGGMVSDLGGFCASTYKRGIAFVNVATTLLSQVDASVGGKLAVDFNGFKNHIGLFGNPKAIYINPNFLNTLPEREVRSGFAEVLKHGLIQSEIYWNQVSKDGVENAVWEAVINHSVNIKKQVVEEDPFEHGIRKCLNFGHTIGHAFETYSLLHDEVPSLLHGEAIAVGMITEAYLSKVICGLSDDALNQINQTILSVFGKVDLDGFDLSEVMVLMGQDKKNVGHQFKFSLIDKIGSSMINITCEEDLVLASIDYYKNIEWNN